MNFMPAPKVFVATNVFVYANDTTVGRKRDMAREAVLNLWNMEIGVLSTRVFQEFFVSLTQKFLFQLIGRRPAQTLKLFVPGTRS